MAIRKESKGTVDRVENDIVVVVVKDPDNPENSKEVYVNKDKFNKKTPKEGDKVTIDSE
jgi:hypothetical protein